MSYTATTQEFEVFPTGEYRVVCTDYEEGVAGKFGEQIKFRFEIVGGEHEGKNISAWVNTKLILGKKPSKLTQIFEAAFNRPIADGETVDLSQLMGRHLIAVILEEQKTDGTGSFNKIVSYKPIKGQKPPPVNPSDDFAVGKMDAEA